MLDIYSQPGSPRLLIDPESHAVLRVQALVAMLISRFYEASQTYFLNSEFLRSNPFADNATQLKSRSKLSV